MAKSDWKRHLKTRLRTAGFIFALTGWLLTVTVTLERVFHMDLSGLENFIRTGPARWGIKLLVLVIVIIMVKGRTGIERMIAGNGWLHTTVVIIYAGGILGWLIGLTSLLFT